MRDVDLEKKTSQNQSDMKNYVREFLKRTIFGPAGKKPVCASFWWWGKGSYALDCECTAIIQNRWGVSSESQEYMLLQCMKVTLLICTVDEMVGFLFLRSNTEYKMNQSLRNGTGALEIKDVGVAELSVVESFQALQHCLNVLRANHTTVPFTDRTPEHCVGFV